MADPKRSPHDAPPVEAYDVDEGYWAFMLISPITFAVIVIGLIVVQS